jgi:hypothetical protein
MSFLDTDELIIQTFLDPADMITTTVIIGSCLLP